MLWNFPTGAVDDSLSKLHPGMPAYKTGRSPHSFFFSGTNLLISWLQRRQVMFVFAVSALDNSICLRCAYTPAVCTYGEHICIDRPMLCIRNCNFCLLPGTHLPTVPLLAYAILWTPAEMPTRAVLKTYTSSKLKLATNKT